MPQVRHERGSCPFAGRRPGAVSRAAGVTGQQFGITVPLLSRASSLPQRDR